MKVLFLTNIPSPYRVDFFNELGKKCELTVLYETRHAGDREDKWFSNKAKYFNEVYLDGKQLGIDNAFSMKVIKYLKDRHYDFIVVGGYSTPTGMLAICYMKLKKIPFILNCDVGLIKDDNFLKSKIKKFFIGGAKAYLSTANDADKYLVHYGAKKEKIYRYPFTSIHKTEVLERPVSYEEKKKIRKQLGIQEEKVIVSVGQFIHRKGFDILLKSCKEISSNTGIYIIGGNVVPCEYLEIIKKLKLEHVHFIDFLKKEELLKYCKAADIFVLPTREDIWGLVINEAMACGLPIITTNKCVAGLELIKDNENGFIIPVSNITELSDKINVILNDKNLQLKISYNNLDKIKEYTIENMAESHFCILQKMQRR